jgi:ribosomal protein S18 acetylase RimI-like enzyme
VCVLLDEAAPRAGAAADRMVFAVGPTQRLVPLVTAALATGDAARTDGAVPTDGLVPTSGPGPTDGLVPGDASVAAVGSAQVRPVPAAGPFAHAWIATDALPALRDRLAALGLRPNRTGWEWMVLRDAPTEVAAERRLRALTPADRDAAAACLAVANPTTEAVPVADGERWWGVDGDDGALLGVIGAEPRAGSVGGTGSWHLHGLGVRPGARGQGLGAALTAGAARALRDAGADWVTLGMWDDNDGARRIYQRLGFRTVHRLVTLHRR